jgi:hypothetical protein
MNILSPEDYRLKRNMLRHYLEKAETYLLWAEELNALPRTKDDHLERELWCSLFAIRSLLEELGQREW